jgi:hypothetical protein
MNGEQLQIYLKEIDKKNSWGKNELKFLILDIISGKIK